MHLNLGFLFLTEASSCRCSKMITLVPECSKMITPVPVADVCNTIQKETLAQRFSCEFCNF